MVMTFPFCPELLPLILSCPDPSCSDTSCVSRQAFLEMNSEEAAQNMVGYYSTVMPVIRNHPVYVQFSNHKELKTDNSPNQEVGLHLTHNC